MTPPPRQPNSSTPFLKRHIVPAPPQHRRGRECYYSEAVISKTHNLSIPIACAKVLLPAVPTQPARYLMRGLLPAFRNATIPVALTLLLSKGEPCPAFPFPRAGAPSASFPKRVPVWSSTSTATRKGCPA